MKLSDFDSNEQTAIIMKYKGNTYSEIAKAVGKEEPTIKRWFSTEGNLYIPYNEYKEEMGEKRQENIEQVIFASDKEIATITTNAIRMVAKQFQTRKVLKVNKKGDAVCDDAGNPQYIEVEPDPTAFNFSSDFINAWRTQRVMQNLPTSYEKQEIEQTNFEADVIIKELNLTDADFNDENIDATNKLIDKYIKSKGTSGRQAQEAENSGEGEGSPVA